MVVKARYDGRVFIPEQPVDLPVGSVVELAVNPPEDGPTGKTLLEKLVEIADQYPDNPDLPTDLAAQHDHYLYGTPKRP